MNSGWWRGVIRLRQCAYAPGSYRLTVDLQDRAGNLVSRRAGPPVTVTYGATPEAG